MQSLSRFLTYLWQYLRKNPYLGPSLIGMNLVLSWLTHGSMLIALIVSVVIGACWSAFDLYLQRLKNRISAKEGPLWIVHVNDVEVGQIEDRHYAAIQLQAYKDARIYMAQGINVASVFFNGLWAILRVVPTLAFWLSIAAMVIAPAEVAQAIKSLQEATTQDLAHWLESFGAVSMGLMAMTLCVLWAINPSSLGGVDHFEAFINSALRRHCRVPAQGTVSLTTTGLYRQEGQAESLTPRI